MKPLKVVADSHHFDEELDPDHKTQLNEKLHADPLKLKAGSGSALK
jgi:hypothetical protein